MFWPWRLIKNDFFSPDPTNLWNIFTMPDLLNGERKIQSLKSLMHYKCTCFQTIFESKKKLEIQNERRHAISKYWLSQNLFFFGKQKIRFLTYSQKFICKRNLERSFFWQFFFGKIAVFFQLSQLLNHRQRVAEVCIFCS